LLYATNYLYKLLISLLLGNHFVELSGMKNHFEQERGW